MTGRDRVRGWAALVAVLMLLVVATPIGDRALSWFAPVVELVRVPQQAWQAVRAWVTDRQALIARLHALERQHAEDRARAQALVAARAELAELRRLLGIAAHAGGTWRAARVIGATPEAMSRRIVLRAPQAQPDDVVVASDGLVGVVAEVDGARAIVRTILDGSVAVPVTDRTGSIALLVRGRGDRLHVAFAPAGAALREGEILRTSGAGGAFPPGIPVARIVRVRERPGGLFLDVEAEPVAHWRARPYLAIVRRP